MRLSVTFLQACMCSQKISVQFNYAFKNIWRSVHVHVQKFGGQKFKIAFTFIFLQYNRWVGAVNFFDQRRYCSNFLFKKFRQTPLINLYFFKGKKYICIK